ARHRRCAARGARGALRREARPRDGPRVLRRPLVPLERGHVHLARRRAARRARGQRARTVRRPRRARRGVGRPGARGWAGSAVAEPAAEKGRLAVIPGQFDWDDVGDFASLWTLVGDGRRDGVTVLGDNPDVLDDDASALVVSQTDRVIAMIGVENLIVVDTPDALLVTTSEHAQRVKQTVTSLQTRGRDNVL